MPDRSWGDRYIEMIQKIDSEREIGIEMIGARELWIGAVYRYKPRGRVDTQRERERELYQKI